MQCPIHSHARKYPRDLALITASSALTYKQVDQNIHIHPVFEMFAKWREAAIYKPLSPRLPPEKKEELAAQLQEVNGPYATALFTSGSTGTPKIACHTIKNHFYSALGSNEVLPLARGDSWLLSLPLYHVGGIAILMRCALAGATLILPEAKVTSTHISLVPTQYLRLPHPEKYKTILLGGAPLPHITYPSNVHPTYGLTEMSSQVMTDGRILPYREMMQAPDGEILVRGKTLFAGYWKQKPPLNEAGWFATGDILKDGEIRRKDRMFISGGENIQPLEIEEALLSISGIHTAEVYGVKDFEWGMRPIARISTHLSISEEEIKTQLRSHLPKFKVPDRVEITRL